MYVVILAGGMGTRLQKIIKDIPKPMANIGKKPFLFYLLSHIAKFDVKNIILSVGYKQEIIKNYFGYNFKKIALSYSCEKKPLGTGGAIKKIFETTDIEEVVVINGDTFANLDLDKFYDYSKDKDMVIAIKYMKNFDRYGCVKFYKDKIISFEEKNFVKEGYINSGIYFLRKSIFKETKEKVFSFEKFLEKKEDIFIYKYSGYFIDIGIPNDYKKAQIDFKEIFW